MICPFLADKKQLETFTEIPLSKSEKRRYLPQFLCNKGFQGYRCKTGIAIFAWRVTKDYVYSPFK